MDPAYGTAQRDRMLITRCTHCNSAFRISREQLDARGGKVRCGRCASVFDARGTLREALDAKPSVAATAGVSHEPTDAPDSDAIAVTADSELIESPQPQVQAHAEQPEEAPLAPSAPASMPPPAARAGARRVAWPAPALLLVLLAAQIAFHFRGEIALVYPEARAPLLDLCAPIGCDLPLPRQSQLMSIENSDLQADPGNPGAMVLTATLRNRALFAQAYPALELTLTDAQDRPLARRVLWAGDYLGRDANREGAILPGNELAARVRFETPTLKPTGYRLYLFFP